MKSVREARYVNLEVTLGLEVDAVGVLNVTVPSATEKPTRDVICGGSARLSTVGGTVSSRSEKVCLDGP